MTRADLTHRIRSRPAPWAFGLGLILGLVGALAAGASAPVVAMVALMSAVLCESPVHGVTLYPVTDAPPLDHEAIRAQWATSAGFVRVDPAGVAPQGALLVPHRRAEVVRAYSGLLGGRPAWAFDVVVRDRRGRVRSCFSYLRLSLPTEMPALRIEPRWVRPGLRDRRADLLRTMRRTDPLTRAWRVIPRRGTDPIAARQLISPGLRARLLGTPGAAGALGIELMGSSLIVCFPHGTSAAQLAYRAEGSAAIISALVGPPPVAQAGEVPPPPPH